jgi:hypothetical protein
MARTARINRPGFFWLRLLRLELDLGKPRSNRLKIVSRGLPDRHRFAPQTMLVEDFALESCAVTSPRQQRDRRHTERLSNPLQSIKADRRKSVLDAVRGPSRAAYGCREIRLAYSLGEALKRDPGAELAVE